jgi:hypothetical protein
MAEAAIDEEIAKATDAAQGQICEAIESIAAMLRQREPFTRAELIVKLEALQVEARATIALAARLANARVVKRVEEIVEESWEAREAEIDHKNALSDEERAMYATALAILEKDAGVYERDLAWVTRQADPVSTLTRVLKRK